MGGRSCCSINGACVTVTTGVIGVVEGVVEASDRGDQRKAHPIEQTLDPSISLAHRQERQLAPPSVLTSAALRFPSTGNNGVRNRCGNLRARVWSSVLPASVRDNRAPGSISDMNVPGSSETFCGKILTCNIVQKSIVKPDISNFLPQQLT